jgi:hypothetical protein
LKWSIHHDNASHSATFSAACPPWIRTRLSSLSAYPVFVAMAALVECHPWGQS